MRPAVNRQTVTAAIPMTTSSEKPVRKSESIATKPFVRSPQNLGERIVEFLREVHPVKTIDSVAADIGVARSTVAKWLEGACTPGAIPFIKLMGAYGPEFVVAVWPNAPKWMHQAYRDHQEEDLNRQMEAIRRKLETLS